MATIPTIKFDLNFETTLASKISASATTLTLDTSVDDDGSSLTGNYVLTMDEGLSNEEHMLVALTGSSGSITIRGLSRVDVQTNQSGNQFEHDRGASVKITNAGLVLFQRALNGVDAFNAPDWTGVNSINGLATPTAGETTKACNVAYANALSIAGANDAATSVKGIVEIATASEAAAGTGTGSTGAILAIPASLCSNTSSATQLIPVTDADGDIPVEFMELDATWTFTSVLNIQTATNWQLAGTAFTGSMATLNEASTFFGSTDITGAEAESLTDGSIVPLTKHGHAAPKSGVSTRTAASGSGVQTIAHGLGEAPRLVQIIAMADAGVGSAYVKGSQGSYDGTNNTCLYWYDINGAKVVLTDGSNAIRLTDSGGNIMTAVITVDATNITITWTKTSSGQDVDFHWIASL